MNTQNIIGTMQSSNDDGEGVEGFLGKANLKGGADHVFVKTIRGLLPFYFPFFPR